MKSRVIRVVVVVAILVAIALLARFQMTRSSGSEPSPSATMSGQPSKTPAGDDEPARQPTPSTTAGPTPNASPQNPSPKATPTRTESTPSRSLSLTPAPIAEPTHTYAGVQVSLDSIEAVTGEARGPGELAGPALRVTVTLRNNTATELPLEGALVNVFYGAAQTPAIQLSGPGVDPFPSVAAPNEVVHGTYVFSVPIEDRSGIAIEVVAGTATPVFVFEGPVQ